ncbi:hypothetical protein OESDEN_13948 [Oesophagostomum dentatum]|uniref:Uncharacterized protein n=1 Tax=Oesophagostomum dentatum TaxID=61180 RepID=A0A0B1SSX6_OESDE|nr:hypothetical protein OESDEN_13948 [Oesophagostomum dentatum]
MRDELGLNMDVITDDLFGKAVQKWTKLLNQTSPSSEESPSETAEPTLDGEQQILLELLEEHSTSYAKAASALYFRRIFTAEIPNETPDPSKYSRLVSFLVTIEAMGNIIDCFVSSRATAVRT